MSATRDRTRQALAVIGAAAAAGVAADVLASTVPDRLDVALGLGALTLAGAAIVQRGFLPVPSALVPLGVPFAFLAAALIWRDSETLFVLNLLGIAILAGMASPRVRRQGRRRSALGDYQRGGAQVYGGAAVGAVPLVFCEIDGRALPRQGPLSGVRSALLGLVAAGPVAAVLGGLLMQADPVFERLMTTTLTGRLEWAVEHGIAVLGWTWLAAGLLRLLLLRPADPPRTGESGGRFGVIEVGTVLVVVDLLFLAFVLVQLRYLFGGAGVIQDFAGMTYAEYARRGFFELVAVAALSLPLLLTADWALASRDRRTLGRFRVLASIMLVLLNVMLVSAVWRMRLYTGEYGLTEQRLYTTAFMGWLVLVLGWFGATVLRGRRNRFGFGALAAGLFVLGALNLLNPDGLIAAANLRRTGAGYSLDTAYLHSLSADALPAIRRALPTLPPVQRCVVVAQVEGRWRTELERGDRWNISYARVGRFLSDPGGGCPAGPGA
jgi:hypothetical protein